MTFQAMLEQICPDLTRDGTDARFQFGHYQDWPITLFTIRKPPRLLEIRFSLAGHANGHRPIPVPTKDQEVVSAFDDWLMPGIRAMLELGEIGAMIIGFKTAIPIDGVQLDSLRAAFDRVATSGTEILEKLKAGELLANLRKDANR